MHTGKGDMRTSPIQRLGAVHSSFRVHTISFPWEDDRRLSSPDALNSARA